MACKRGYGAGAYAAGIGEPRLENRPMQFGVEAGMIASKIFKEENLMEKIEKSNVSSQEFYIPHAGLDLDFYLDMKLPGTASHTDIRLLKQAIHHLGRYYWAIQTLKEKRDIVLLDIGCGAGYGSYLLAKFLPDAEVLGGDYDQRAVDFANSTFEKLPNLNYKILDFISWKDAANEAIGKFNVIVSFDVIEHLHFREIALINVAENLSADGIFLFSTPCGKSDNKYNPEWEHHKIEYSYIYLVNLMKRFFHDVRIPGEDAFPGQSFWDNKINKDTMRYFNRANPMYCTLPVRHGLASAPHLP